MKKLLWVVTVVLVALVAFAALQMVASETGEVVVLTTQGERGGTTTRLWVVDHDGAQWLRGGPDSGWVARLLAEPRVTVRRNDRTARYRAQPEPERIAEINALMAAKYGWRDDVVNLMAGDRANDLAIRLIPSD